eukprot:3090390-Ditylum_brightwellii.AAC.1
MYSATLLNSTRAAIEEYGNEVAAAIEILTHQAAQEILLSTSKKDDIIMDADEGTGSKNAADKSEDDALPRSAMIGIKVKSFFENYGWFEGEVIEEVDSKYKVKFEDGDGEI